MPHQTETAFESAVAEWFKEEYGPNAVTRQKYLEGPRWFCDIVVDTGFARLFIEVENDAGSIRDGIGQTLGYAATDLERGFPMIVTPAGHIDKDRLALLRQNGSTLIREFSAEEEVFV